MVHTLIVIMIGGSVSHDECATSAASTAHL